MERVIISVQRQHEPKSRDLEVPAQVEASRLALLIAQALQWEGERSGQPVEYEIVATPPGRVLHAQESLADAGVWDGAWLVFRERQEAEASPEPASAPPSSTPADGPVTGWRSLGIDLPGERQEQKGQPGQDTGSTGFAWKRLD